MVRADIVQQPSRKAGETRPEGADGTRGLLEQDLLVDAYASVARALPYALAHGGFVSSDLAGTLHADFSAATPPIPAAGLRSDSELTALLSELPEAVLADRSEAAEARSSDEACLMQALAKCGTVELKTIDRLSEALANHLADALAEQYPIAPDMARYLAAEARNEAIARAMERAPQERIDAFMNDLKAHGQVSPERVLAYARRGDSPLFHTILGRCAELEPDMVAAFIEDGGARVLERILMRTDFSSVMREAILSAYNESTTAPQ